MGGRSDFQGVFAGGFQPFFRFRLTSEPREDRIISSGGSTPTVASVLDATETTTEFTSAVIGTQFKINSVVEYAVDSGEIPDVDNFSSSNESIATIDSNGNVTHVSDGDVTITGTSDPSARTGTTRSAQIDITLSSAGGQTSEIVTYTPDPLDVSEHVLILWNSNVADSTTCKNYYLANRPEFGTYSGGNTPNSLDCPCTTTGTDGIESITQSNFESQIRTVVLNWMTANPTKNIRYIVMMYGMPSRVTSTGQSVQYQLSRALSDTGSRTGTEFRHVENVFTLAEYQGTTALVSSLNMATLADAQAYIDKLKTIYNGMAVGNVVISANENNQGGTDYYFDDNSRLYTFNKPGNDNRLAVLEANASATITYAGNSGDTSPTPDQTTHITSASNVAGYCTWGYNGGQGGNYANDGSVTFSGNSNWYAIMSIESFNGQRSTFQENIQGWFAADAFGGTSYSNTPAIAVSHVEEPFLSGVNDGEYFKMWEQEDSNGPMFLGIEAAWAWRNTPFFQCLGDPLITR